MHVRGSASGIEILAPAKLNLFLEVVGKRVDGFHEIETLMVPISLFDTLIVDCDTHFEGTRPRETRADSGTADPSDRISADRISLEVITQVGQEPVPAGEDNLVVRAVRLLAARAGVAPRARLRLIKRIPMAAGLAGGSSDAAAAIVGMNRAWRLNWSAAQLASVAAELGSDIPFFLGRGAAICRGRGEQIEYLSANQRQHARLHVVVARPPEGLSTAAVYRACQPATARRDAGGMVAALCRGDIAKVGALLHNQLQPAAQGLSPWIARLRKEFSQLDVLGHQMSGSGTSYFGICRHATHARRLAAVLRSRGIGRVFAAGSCY